MAGRPLHRMMLAELERATRESFEVEPGEECPHSALDYACSWLEDGRTIVALARALSEAVGVDITPGRITTYLHTFAEGEVRLSESRRRASHLIAEGSLEIVDEPQYDSAGVSRAASRARARQWLAAKWNRRDYGDDKGANVTISIGSMHLDALRAPRPTLEVSASLTPALPSSLKCHENEDAQDVVITSLS